MSKTIHMILQGKGGVGKSLAASFIAQYFTRNDVTPICIDTDPVNATFAGYKAFNATRIDLMNGDDLDTRAFDELIELVMGADEDSVFVIDNGASTFVPLCSWMIENDAVKFLQDADVKIIVHSVVTGGQALSDTLTGLGSLLKQFDVPVVVWLNEFFGKPEHNGTPFEDSALFTNNQEKIHALVKIEAKNRQTFGYDLDQILRKKMTFSDAMQDASISIMARQRLKMIWDGICKQLSAANL